MCIALFFVVATAGAWLLCVNGLTVGNRAALI
jgi:hypothetical protein